MLRSLDTGCGGAAKDWHAFLGWQMTPSGILPSPGALPPWSPGTSEQHVQIRIVKKKKIIMKKRKKLTHPGPLVTAKPPVTTTPAGALDPSEEQEPGIATPGTLPRLAAPGPHTNITFGLMGIGMPPACPALGQAWTRLLTCPDHSLWSCLTALPLPQAAPPWVWSPCEFRIASSRHPAASPLVLDHTGDGSTSRSAALALSRAPPRNFLPPQPPAPSPDHSILFT